MVRQISFFFSFDICVYLPHDLFLANFQIVVHFVTGLLTLDQLRIEISPWYCPNLLVCIHHEFKSIVGQAVLGNSDLEPCFLKHLLFEQFVVFRTHDFFCQVQDVALVIHLSEEFLLAAATFGYSQTPPRRI